MPTQPPQPDSADSDSGDSWDGAVAPVAVQDEPRKPQKKRKLDEESDGEDVGSESEEEEEDTTGEDTEESEAEAPAPKKKGPLTKKLKQPAAKKPEAASKQPDGPAKKKAKAKVDAPPKKAADAPSTTPAATKARKPPLPFFFKASPLATEGGEQTRPGCTPEEELALLQAYIEGETEQHTAKMGKLLAAATNDKGKVPKALVQHFNGCEGQVLSTSARALYRKQQGEQREKTQLDLLRESVAKFEAETDCTVKATIELKGPQTAQ